MTIKVDPDWWKKLFDDVYLLTDARSVCNEEITQREVDVICEIIPVEPEQKILDLCGGHGRHSIELYSRGYKKCTVLDYSQTLLHYAKEVVTRRNYFIHIIQSDARKTGLLSGAFDCVIIMGNSMGYIQEPGADREILAEAYRVLNSGGRILVDVTDGASVKKNINPNAWHEIGTDTVVCRQREVSGNKIHAREVVLSREKGLIRDQTYAIQLYESKTLGAMLEAAGFKQVYVHTEFSPHECAGDYGCMNHRMIAAGQKL
ncbi:class I SAM-dependent methyltransferase [Thermodesulfobacteriota bacterium]